ncbi:hypothetical protein LX77_00480 [Gelidibacter algens]|uniref:Uncharacterized protein n=1 Tax=Gelidibacter algens TaxID=49280 RepID=A0A1A7R8T3_9FLAO|nr:hypothetical protein [Gelidibacter algens]OBX27132.1 hypothetical protein A9996_01790 [Gelidibacter algens]RAJ27906.1 hypothetical protein LX77_00480 [Gelidibacter algens]
MQKHNHIKALLFLGIFSLFLLHQIVPHLHHQHEVEHSHKAVAHSESHSHDVPEKESPKKGLLDLFLEVHIHTVGSNEVLVTHESSVKHLKFKRNVNTSIYVNHYSLSIDYDEAEKVAVYQPPNTYFNPYLSCLDSRGPPSLG